MICAPPPRCSVPINNWSTRGCGGAGGVDGATGAGEAGGGVDGFGAGLPPGRLFLLIKNPFYIWRETGQENACKARMITSAATSQPKVIMAILVPQTFLLMIRLFRSNACAIEPTMVSFVSCDGFAT